MIQALRRGTSGGNRNSPSWRFPPTGGGAEQGANPGQKHFTQDSLPNMIRETLQNALDHPEPGLETVRVTFRTMTVGREDIGADSLAPHIRASLQEAERGRNPDATKHYREMEAVLEPPRIECLAVIDQNTTGLQNENWLNLIFREGMPTNTGSTTKGGSVGLGKHAPFNLSSCNTVIYSTRYVSRKAKGKVCHMAGRSQLMTHELPGETSRLQNVGFLGIHDERSKEYNQPIAGPDIPEPFQLKQSGTGVFIIGFRRERFPSWVQLTAREILRNFFHAIHAGNLEIHLQDPKSGTETALNQQSLGTEMELLGEKERSRQYFQAIQGEPQETSPSGRLGPPRRMMVWISNDGNAPKRLAHLNRRGMLITDDGRIRDNPFMPYGSGGWAPWCAVTMAADEETDRFIRRMEPATHNAIHPGELMNPAEQEDATRELKHHREQIAKLIRNRIEQDSATRSSNITELAELFPDLSLDQGTDLEWQEIKPPLEGERLWEPSGNPDDDEDEDRDKAGKPGASGDHGPGSPRDRGRNRQEDAGGDKDRRTLDRHRIIRTSPAGFAASFTMPKAKNDTITLSLRTAGEQHQYNEERVRVSGVTQTGDLLGRAAAQDGDIIVQAPPETPIVLMISTEKPESRYSGYKLTIEDREEAG